MSRPLINILIRTSDRPEYFRRCIQHIDEQLYCDVRVLVSADSKETAAYVRAEGIEPILVPRMERTATKTFPWNLYLNALKAHVKEGWILILDDDDYLSNELALQVLANSLPDEDTMLVCKMEYPDGSTLPDEAYWGKTPFTRRHISMPTICFHSKWKHHVDFDGMRAGDYRFANKLLKYVKGVKWLDYVVVGLSNYGLNGSKKDLNEKG